MLTLLPMLTFLQAWGVAMQQLPHIREGCHGPFIVTVRLSMLVCNNAVRFLLMLCVCRVFPELDACR